jgi:hypothetical protein
MNNKTSKYRKILSILSFSCMIFFGIPSLCNWFYIPMIWGKVIEFWF